jgi:L-threonylcarbamoyladenylate synthase
MAEGEVEQAIAALRAGRPVLLPTDTVYGLCASPYRAAAVDRMYRVKGRDSGRPTALLATSHELLFECVPELRGRAGVIARAVLPGPYTLVLPNPARRFRWLTGTRPETIGVRIPELPESSRRVVDGVGAVAATSANVAGGPDPAAVDEVPEEVLSACGAVVGEGRLPGTPSTVIDFTGPEPVVLREGPAPADDAIARAEAALAH